MKNWKFLLIVGLFSIFAYILFYSQLFVKDNFFWGSDVRTYYHPAREYFYEVVTQEHRFPFWTERQFSGFPIYADFETGYLHPINIISIVLFGPMLSYKILHFVSYMVGSLSLFYFLKRKKVSIIPAFVAHLVFFFSFFNINHQIHYNIIMVTFLFPLKILLADLFLEKKQFKYILFQSLVIASGFYWGHMQTVLLSLIGIFTYMAVFSYKKESWKTFINYHLVLGFLCFVQIIPLVTSAYPLFAESDRIEKVTHRFGSLTPSMFPLILFPFLFGRQAEYIGRQIHLSYTYTELYIYAGIVAIILTVSGLFLLKKNRIYYFSYFTFVLFFVFSFIGHLPLINDSTPLVSLFRFWVRITYVTLFGIGIFSALFLQSILDGEIFKNITRRTILNSLYLILLFPGYLFLLYLLKPAETFTFSILEAVNFKGILFSNDFLVWLTIATLTVISFISFYFINKYKKNFNQSIGFIFVVFILILVTVDLRYFGQDVLNHRIKNYSEDFNKLPKPIEGYDNKRIVILGGGREINGMEFLYYKFWSPFGYSQLRSAKYLSSMKINGLSTVPDNVNVHGSESGYTNLSRLGITDVINLNSDKAYKVIQNPIDLLDDMIDGEYLKKIEGDVAFTVYKNPESQNIRTYLRSDNNWTLKINGVSSDLNKDEIFLSFDLPKGENILVELKYIPYDLYKGLGLSVFLALAFIFGAYFTNYKKYKLWQ